jgi:acetyl coenzyme A synthetase (ADP forming)-like protein
MSHSLDAILRPRSVAVLGASRTRGTLAAEVFHNLLRGGLQGAVYPVNPRAAVVQSVRAYATIDDVPEVVDLAVIVLPAAQVAEAVEACGRRGVRGVLVISAGFAEVGEAGAARQAAVTESLRRWGMRMVGPNCLGVMNTDPAVRLDATFAPGVPSRGPLAISSQSGALGLAILEQAEELGVGVSMFVSVGNKADVDGSDLVEYFATDPASRVILLYLENLGDPARFLDVTRRAARERPVIAVKSGRTEAGARAASSHTGALAGADVAVDALLRQAGVIRTDTIDELFDVAMLLAHQPVPQGRRVAILTNAGGPGIMATDACESRGLEVVALHPDTEAALRAFLPPEASVRNPVDMIASASAESYGRALRLLQADPHVDALLVLFVPPVVTHAADVAEAIRGAARAGEKPIATCFMGRHGVPEALRTLREGHFPSYAFPEGAARALAHAARYGAWRRRPEGAVPALDGVDRETARRLVDDAPAGWLSPAAVRALLTCYGIPTLPQADADTPDDAAEAAAHLGFPVALKLRSARITHKSDVGGVALNLRDREGVRAAFATMAAGLAAQGLGDAMDGVTLQGMAPKGVETFVGLTRSPAHGALVAFGAGGVHVEVWRDVTFGVAPLRDVDAREMVDRIRARALLEGFRGGPVADKAAIADVLLRVSAMGMDLPRVAELDINPLNATPGGVVAVDARVRVD